MDTDSEGQKNQGILVDKGTIMTDITLATIVGVLAVLLIVGLPLILITLLLNGVFMDNEEDNNNLNTNDYGNN